MIQTNRFEIWLVQLDPAKGHEIRKTRPCVIISPDEMSALSTVIMAPMTSKGFEFPIRVPCKFQNKNGLILLDQVRAVDKSRLVKKMGELDIRTQEKVCKVLQEMFAY